MTDRTTGILELTTPAPGVALLTLNRPDRLNALDRELVTELHRTLREIDQDHGCRVVVLTGAGRGFCAGLDLAGFGVDPATEDFGRPQQAMAMQQFIADLVPALRDIRQPVIAAVNGAATGGGFALALASDLRICGRSARFGTAFVRLGLLGCDIGVSWLLPRLIGASRAWELMLTGRVFDADEAHELGLVTRLVDDDALLDTALEFAGLIAANSPFGVWMTRKWRGRTWRRHRCGRRSTSRIGPRSSPARPTTASLRCAASSKENNPNGRTDDRRARSSLDRVAVRSDRSRRDRHRRQPRHRAIDRPRLRRHGCDCRDREPEGRRLSCRGRRDRGGRRFGARRPGRHR